MTPPADQVDLPAYAGPVQPWFVAARIRGSSNGRTADFGSVYPGSIPGPRASPLFVVLSRPGPQLVAPLPSPAFLCEGEDATRSLAEALGRVLPMGSLIALHGDLGSGKTVFAQGLAWGLGVDRGDYVNSPSYVYVREHQGRVPFFHADLYRVSDPEELELIGLRDYLDERSVLAVEWPDRVPGWLPRRGLGVHILEQGAGRRIEIEALDPEAGRVLQALLEAMERGRGEGPGSRGVP